MDSRINRIYKVENVFLDNPCRIYFVCVLLCFTSSVFSQGTITGIVKNQKGEPLIVNVLFQPKGSTSIAGFTATSSEGAYSFNYKGITDSIEVIVTGMNIERTSQIISAKKRVANFIVNEKVVQLREVVVVPQKIQRAGDTLNYSVSAYIDQSDRVIGDVIKKMPGIELSASGGIKYRGVNINKFYIENLDLLQGRYGIATNNISANDVATVQILENHQPIRAISKTAFSDAAAINIKLKESAKGTLALMALLGAAYKPWGWDAELQSTYFSRDMQNIITYKSNDIGKSLRSELRRHYDDERLLLSPASMLSVSEPSTPPIALKRYFDNNSHAVTANHLSKLTDSIQAVTSVVYLYDYEKKKGYSLSEQYLPDNNLLVVEEDMISKARKHNVDVSIKLNANKSDYYFNNYLNLTGSFNDLTAYTNMMSESAGLNEFINDKLDMPSYGINNTFNLIKNTGKNSYNFYCSASYMYKPHNLTVVPAYYWSEDSLYALRQELLSKTFATNARSSYKIRVQSFELDYTLWLRIERQNFNSDLHGKDIKGNIEMSADSLRNDLSYHTYRVGLTQSYSYDRPKFKAKLVLPLHTYILYSDDHILDNRRSRNRLLADPSINLNFLVSPELNWGLNGSYKKNLGDINSTYSGYIMHNYRNFLRNTADDFFESESIGANMKISYSDAFNSFFFDVSSDYNYSKRNVLFGVDYRGIMSDKSTIGQSSSSDGYRTRLTISKGLDFLRATLRFNGYYDKSRDDVLIQDRVLQSASERCGFGTNLDIRPKEFVRLQYSFSWNKSRNYIVSQSSHFPEIRTVSQTGIINLFPIKQLTVSANVEYQYNSAAFNKNTAFADVNARLKTKRIEYELEVNNVFNAKHYLSKSYNSVNTFFHIYNLRPANMVVKLRFKLK